MINKDNFIEYNKELGNIDFKVSDSKKKHAVGNSLGISEMKKLESDRIPAVISQ
ncbi:MAG: hypothetical protein ACI3XA_08275 [Clostridia bacterium]